MTDEELGFNSVDRHWHRNLYPMVQACNNLTNLKMYKDLIKPIYKPPAVLAKIAAHTRILGKSASCIVPQHPHVGRGVFAIKERATTISTKDKRRAERTTGQKNYPHRDSVSFKNILTRGVSSAIANTESEAQLKKDLPGLLCDEYVLENLADTSVLPDALGQPMPNTRPSTSIHNYPKESVNIKLQPVPPMDRQLVHNAKELDFSREPLILDEVDSTADTDIYDHVVHNSLHVISPRRSMPQRTRRTGIPIVMSGGAGRLNGGRGWTFEPTGGGHVNAVLSDNVDVISENIDKLFPASQQSDKSEIRVPNNGTVNKVLAEESEKRTEENDNYGDSGFQVTHLPSGIDDDRLPRHRNSS
ncbi:hypothetical protein TKK_0011978 [Trichogramma kaykai]